RERFPHWTSRGDGCDTRDRVLIEESLSRAQVDIPCTVVAGDWRSPYDGVEVTDPAELEIDHVVALHEAWQSGAAHWTEARREAFANDLSYEGTLVAVTSATNRSKSDRDPAEWRPPAREAWCRFALDWITVKVRWGLTADEAERRSLADLLATCPRGRAPSPADAGAGATGASRWARARPRPGPGWPGRTGGCRRSRWRPTAARGG